MSESVSYIIDQTLWRIISGIYKKKKLKTNILGYLSSRRLSKKFYDEILLKSYMTHLLKKKSKKKKKNGYNRWSGALLKVLNCSFSDCPCSFLFKVLDAFLHILKTTDVNPSENA